MKMKKKMRKSLSLLLAVVLCCALPISAFAEGTETPEPVVEEVAVDFSGENVPSVSVTVTPGSSNTGSADASGVLAEAAKEEVEQIKNNLPDSGYVDNGDGTHSVTSNAPIYGENGEIIGYNTTTITQSNDPTVEGEIKTEKETVQPAGADRNVTASMSEVTNNGSGDPADWDMESIAPTVELDAKNYVDEEKDLRIIDDDSCEYHGPMDALDWENHAFAFITPTIGSQICVDMITAPSGLPFEGPGIYELQNEQGEKFYAYCMDANVLAEPGHPYDMLNVEDAEYLSEEDAKHVRFVVENGYWGTVSEKDADGNLVAIEEGSLDAMKDMMTNATDADGNPVFTEEEIALLTDGVALSVTQAAIWYYGNSGKDAYKVNDENIIGSGAVFTGRYYNSIQVSNKTEDVLAFEEEKNKNLTYASENSKVDDATIALAQKLFEFMLDGTKEANDDTTAITAKNAFESATITVNNQVAEDLNMLADSAPKNYNVDVAFTLGVVPGEGDTMKVEVYQLDADGNVVMDGDQPVVLSCVEVEVGKVDYKVEGLELPNGSSITLNLSGINKLEKGVYIYSAVSFNDSQTMVGYAEGNQAVDLNVNLSFSVDEPELYKERTVHTDVYVEPDTPNPPPEEDIPEEDPPLEDIPEEDPPLEDIFEEEVPLADVPHTGDNSIYFVIMSVLAVMGLAALTLTKKREAI